MTPYIFVDTGFKRKGQTIISMAAMEPKRHITLHTEEIASLLLDEVLQKVADIIRAHYRESGGSLPLWGEIQYYLYHHINGTDYQFQTDGSLCDSVTVSESIARMSL